MRNYFFEFQYIPQKKSDLELLFFDQYLSVIKVACLLKILILNNQ